MFREELHPASVRFSYQQQVFIAFHAFLGHTPLFTGELEGGESHFTHLLQHGRGLSGKEVCAVVYVDLDCDPLLQDIKEVRTHLETGMSLQSRDQVVPGAEGLE